MDIGYKAEFRLIRTDYRRDSSLNKSGGFTSELHWTMP